jgi:putative adenylate-forming enzyme
MRILTTARVLASFARAKINFTRWKTRDELLIWQEAQLQKHLRFVLPRSPFYANRFTGDWRSLPVSEKADVMEKFSLWNTAGVTLERALKVARDAEDTRNFSETLDGLTVGLSSGTSGGQGVFLVSGGESCMWAGTVLARVIHDLRFSHRIALFMRADSRLYQTASTSFCQVEFFDTEKPIEKHLDRLSKFRPTILVGPPLVLRGICLSGAKIHPEQVISVADVLEDRDRAAVENIFGVRCGELYQATEGFLACSCRYGNLHWNEDALIIEKEWVTADSYRPILTDFRRSTQPILRYRLEDVIKAGDEEPCPCGSVFAKISRISGRCDEVLRIDGGDREVSILPDFIRREVCGVIPVRVEYRIVQTGADLWEIHLSDRSFFPEVERRLRELIQRQGAVPPKMIDKTYVKGKNSAKGRRVVCLLQSVSL